MSTQFSCTTLPIHPSTHRTAQPSNDKEKEKDMLASYPMKAYGDDHSTVPSIDSIEMQPITVEFRESRAAPDTNTITDHTQADDTDLDADIEGDGDRMNTKNTENWTKEEEFEDDDEGDQTTSPSGYKCNSEGIEGIWKRKTESANLTIQFPALPDPASVADVQGQPSRSRSPSPSISPCTRPHDPDGIDRRDFQPVPPSEGPKDAHDSREPKHSLPSESQASHEQQAQSESKDTFRVHSVSPSDPDSLLFSSMEDGEDFDMEVEQLLDWFPVRLNPPLKLKNGKSVRNALINIPTWAQSRDEDSNKKAEKAIAVSTVERGRRGSSAERGREAKSQKQSENDSGKGVSRGRRVHEAIVERFNMSLYCVDEGSSSGTTACARQDEVSRLDRVVRVASRAPPGGIAGLIMEMGRSSIRQFGLVVTLADRTPRSLSSSTTTIAPKAPIIGEGHPDMEEKEKVGILKRKDIPTTLQSTPRRTKDKAFNRTLTSMAFDFDSKYLKLPQDISTPVGYISDIILREDRVPTWNDESGSLSGRFKIDYLVGPAIVLPTDAQIKVDSELVDRDKAGHSSAVCSQINFQMTSGFGAGPEEAKHDKEAETAVRPSLAKE